MTIQATCNAACWNAVEPVCVCMCGGANHGVMQRGGAQPGRYRQRAGTAYQLAEILDSLNSVMAALGRLYDAHQGPRRGEIAFMERATGHQLKWPEVEHFLASARFKLAYLLWERQDKE